MTYKESSITYFKRNDQNDKRSVGMLTDGIPRLYTGKIFQPEIQTGENSLTKFSLAAFRKNGITTHNILSPGDVFVELRIRGNQNEYHIPIDFWDLYRVLTQCAKPSGILFLAARGTEVRERLEKVGVNLARAEALRLTKRIADWPKNDLLTTGLTHKNELFQRASELLNESYFALSFADLVLRIPGGLPKASLRISLNQETARGESPSIKVDYELESASEREDEMVLA